MKQLFSDIEKTSIRGPWSLREKKLTRLWSRLAIWCVMCGEEGKWKTAVLQGLEHRPLGPSPQDSGNVQSRVTERKKLAGKASDRVPWSLQVKAKYWYTGKDSMMSDKERLLGAEQWSEGDEWATAWAHRGWWESSSKQPSGEVSGAEQRHSSPGETTTWASPNRV